MIIGDLLSESDDTERGLHMYLGENSTVLMVDIYEIFFEMQHGPQN